MINSELSGERNLAVDFIKDPYVFEYSQPYKATEHEIETALIGNLQKFLLELGKEFSFVGRH